MFLIFHDRKITIFFEANSNTDINSIFFCLIKIFIEQKKFSWLFNIFVLSNQILSIDVINGFYQWMLYENFLFEIVR